MWDRDSFLYVLAHLILVIMFICGIALVIVGVYVGFNGIQFSPYTVSILLISYGIYVIQDVTRLIKEGI